MSPADTVTVVDADCPSWAAKEPDTSDPGTMPSALSIDPTATDGGALARTNAPAPSDGATPSKLALTAAPPRVCHDNWPVVNAWK